jgi:hypothetical protein
MRGSKLVLPYRDDEGIIRGETVSAIKEGNYYRINSIPLYASRIALYDLISIRNRAGTLYFHKIIETSGRNVIQMTLLKKRQISGIEKYLGRFDCLYRHSDDKRIVAFDVPKHVLYQPIKNWLDQGEQDERWGYREACLSHE